MREGLGARVGRGSPWMLLVGEGRGGRRRGTRVSGFGVLGSNVSGGGGVLEKVAGGER
jgi:hypothetical protein